MSSFALFQELDENIDNIVMSMHCVWGSGGEAIRLALYEDWEQVETASLGLSKVKKVN